MKRIRAVWLIVITGGALSLPIGAAAHGGGAHGGGHAAAGPSSAHAASSAGTTATPAATAPSTGATTTAAGHHGRERSSGGPCYNVAPPHGAGCGAGFNFPRESTAAAPSHG